MEVHMKRTLKPISLWVAFAFAISILQLRTEPATVFAQSIVGRISGTITDTTGGVLRGATVKITNEATASTRSVTADDNGFYIVTNLPPGNYTITVEQTGFKKSVQTGYTLVADGRLTADISLEAGAISESVSVTAVQAETVNTTSGELARVIDGAQLSAIAFTAR